MQVTMDAVRAARRALLPPQSVSTMAQCVAAIERLGFVWPFTPGTELLPALFPALAAESEGQRWDLMWPWKDKIATSRQAYYGKLVTGKPTFVSLEWLTVFYALTGNTGDVEDDLAELAGQVRLQDLAFKVCRYLKEYGPTGTRTLVAKLTDGSPAMKRSLDKALEQLDSAMLITKSGTEGGNSIANIWDLFPRFHPDAVDKGTEIPTREAAVKLLEHYFFLTPAVTEKDLPKLFPWNQGHQQKAITRLLEAGYLARCTLEGKPGLALASFIEE